jgi:outer membrane protein OmpA-like peptidoglycan-associated protein
MKALTFKPLALAVACALIFAGCASTPRSAALDAAQADVNAAATNPDVVARAPLELKMAQEALDRAERAQREREKSVEIDHQAYLASVRARTAQDLASARRSTDELAQVQTEVDRVRLAARTREAVDARLQAQREAQDARIARSQADAANQQAIAANRDARIASQQAQAAADQAALERSRADAAARDSAEAQERVRVLQTQIAEVQARVTERGLLVTLGDVLFLTGRYELQPTAAPRLDKLAAFLKQFPEKRLRIEGYTDSTGSTVSNRELSERRAEAVRSALLARGVDPARIEVAAYGEAYPIASNNTIDGRALNRRVEVVVSDENGNLRARDVVAGLR